MIGIFDSGFGGLTVLKSFLEDDNLKKYDYLYLGDNARAPYGSKSDEVIYNYTKEAVEFLFSNGAELVILACNTASAKALRRIQQEYLPNSQYSNRRVLGVIIPVAEKLVELLSHNTKHITRNKFKLGIIGTKSTINSKVYDQEIEKLYLGKPTPPYRAPLQGGDFSLEIISKATPLLVPLIEEGWIKRKETKMILRTYLRSLKNEHIDYLITGCTHYPLLLKQIEDTLDKRTDILNTPDIVSEKLNDYLQRHGEIEKKLSKNSNLQFYTTDNKEKFKNDGSKFLGKGIAKVGKIVIN